jgi:hypothetical protein
LNDEDFPAKAAAYATKEGLSFNNPRGGKRFAADA